MRAFLRPPLGRETAVTMPFIYALADPRTPSEMRYVGMAMHKGRPYSHVGQARKGVKSYCYNWIRSLLADGLEPAISILEECLTDATQKEVGQRERYYIKLLRDDGHQLTNVADGGFGGMMAGKHHTAEAKAKISLESKNRRRKPHSVEAREKMRLAKLGKKRVPHSAETRLKQSLAQKGRKGKSPSAETLKKLSTAGKLAWITRRERNQ